MILSAALLASVSTISTAQAIDCAAELPAVRSGHWSYRLIDGRKCWYEGKPGLSKSMLEWPPRVSSAQRSRPHEEVARAMPVESPGKMMDAQAWAPAVADTFEELWRTRVLSTGR